MTATQTVRTTINYALDPAMGGVDTYTLGTANYYKRKFAPALVDIKDIRGSEEDYRLDHHGFQLVKHASSAKDFTDQENIKNVVYPETEELLKRITGATKAKVFSNVVRRCTTNEVLQDIKDNNIADDEIYAEKVAPATFAHIDQGQESARKIMKAMLPEAEAAQLGHSRWGIINVWRPLGPVKRDPLSVCDSRSVADEDLVSVYSVPKTKTYGGHTIAMRSEGEKFQVLHLKENPAHQWYFASDMMPDEVLLIAIFDTKVDKKGAARRVPHTAFSLKDSDDSPARESIELRTLVFWEDQTLQ